MYHYVRDLPTTRFPRIKGLLTDAFRHQVDSLRTTYEMATLESALAFWRGDYVPTRDLCLLTFDDGLQDHYTDVLPILAERSVQGLFFLITASCEERRVVSAHKNHFLTAALGLETYRAAFLRRLREVSAGVDVSVDLAQVRRTYRWDSEEAGAFKYLLNFRLSAAMRDQVLDRLFHDHLGDETQFAQQLYVSWEQARQMQRSGMLMGGHSHNHMALATLSPEAQRKDLETCATLLRRQLDGQTVWPFSYPYGKAETFNGGTVQALRDNGFVCAFGTVPGATQPGDDVYALRRVDTKSLQSERLTTVAHA